jgi:hypothetical protein
MKVAEERAAAGLAAEAATKLLISVITASSAI